MSKFLGKSCRDDNVHTIVLTWISIHSCFLWHGLGKYSQLVHYNLFVDSYFVCLQIMEQYMRCSRSSSQRLLSWAHKLCVSAPQLEQWWRFNSCSGYLQPTMLQCPNTCPPFSSRTLVMVIVVVAGVTSISFAAAAAAAAAVVESTGGFFLLLESVPTT